MTWSIQCENGCVPAAAMARPLASAASVSSRRMWRTWASSSSTFRQIVRPHLDDRLVQLALHLVAEHRRAGRHQFADVRAQLPRLRVDDLELFLDADGEAVRHDQGSLRARRADAWKPLFYPTGRQPSEPTARSTASRISPDFTSAFIAL